MLTVAQAHVAAAYNAGQTRSAADIPALALFKGDPNGVEFARSVASFQETWQLTPDGKLGPATMAKARTVAAKIQVMATPVPGITRIGAWAMRGAVYTPDDDLAIAANIRLTDVSLCVHGADFGKPFKPFVSAAEFARIARDYRALGITPHAMFWPQPDAIHAQAVVRYLNDVLDADGPLGSADLDAEEPWTTDPRRAKQGRSVANLYRSLWPEKLPLAVNGITLALPNLLDLLVVADIAIPQAYTEANQSTIPGERQTHVIAKWRAANPRAEIVCGLAAYRQEGAGGLSAEEALRRAYDAAEAAGCRQVRYWDLGELASGKDRAFVTAKCKGLVR